MKQICKYTGITLAHDNCLDSLGVTYRQSMTVGQHLVFSYPLSAVLRMAAHKPIPTLSTRQRHLLFVALLKHTGLVTFKFPLIAEHLDDQLVQNLFPALLNSALHIALNRDYWNDMLPEIARIEVRQDNATDISWKYFINEILATETTVLAARSQHVNSTPSLRARKKRNLLEDEILLERELKEQLTKHRESLKNYIYTANIGKKVLDILVKELYEVGAPLSASTFDLYTHILTRKPDQIKASVRALEALRTQIVEVIGGAVTADGTAKYVSIAPEDAYTRSNVAITVGYLDKIISDWNSVTTLFGAITSRDTTTLPAAFPSNYEIITVTANRFQVSTPVLPMAPKNPNTSTSTNPAILAILAKRAAAANGSN